MRSTKLDPFTLEVIQNALGTIGDEMALTIMRSAYSEIVKDALDFSTGLCDRQGRLIGQGVTIIGHLGSFPRAVRGILETYAGRINDGDIFILNDPYGSGGIHLPDIYIVKPVFFDGALQAFSCALAHHTDVGGIVPGSNSTGSTEIYQDGLRIPSLKLYESGVANDAIFAILGKNVRVPLKVLGDLRATIAAAKIGEREYHALAERYGSLTLRNYCDELLDYTERLARNEISMLPKGSYEFTDYVDGDGSQAGTVVIHVKVSIDGDQIYIDFAGSSPQVRAGINSPLPYTESAARGAVRLILDPAIPNTEGYFRAIEVTAPPGTVVNPVEPGACGARGITGFRVMDAVMGALAQAVPDRVPADGEGGNTILSMGGYDSNLEPFIYVELVAGSRGGAPWGDGVESIPHLLSNVANTPIEMLETQLPVRIEEYSLLTDTGGAGKFRGALAHARQIRLLAASAVLQIRSDKRHHPPYGLCGGREGTPSLNILNPGPDQEILPTLAVRSIRGGDVIRHVLASGGGWGDPLDREPELVRQDILDDKLSLPAALELYGVVLQSPTSVVDLTATERVRAERRQGSSRPHTPR